jgi:hypothetical protein
MKLIEQQSNGGNPKIKAMGICWLTIEDADTLKWEMTYKLEESLDKLAEKKYGYLLDKDIYQFEVILAPVCIKSHFSLFVSF